jgi:hypothetical protein
MPMASAFHGVQGCGRVGRSLHSVRGLPATARTVMALLAVAACLLQDAGAVVIDAADCKFPYGDTYAVAAPTLSMALSMRYLSKKLMAAPLLMVLQPEPDVSNQCWLM